MIAQRIAYIIFSFLLTTTLYARELFFTSIEIDSEQSQASAISICQDQRGGIWFGNSFLNLYADNTLKTFRISDYIDNVEDVNIHMLCGGSDDKIYFLANTRIICYDSRLEKFTDMGINSKTICYANQQLYYTENNQVFIYQGKDKQPSPLITLPDSITRINKLLFKDSTCWLATNKGVYSYTKNKLICLFDQSEATCLFIDKAGNLWVGTSQNGVSFFNHQTGLWSRFHEKEEKLPLINNQIRCINEDNLGNIWIGTYKGLSILSSSLQHITHATDDSKSPWSLNHSSVYSIYKDKQGGMWVGTYYGGLNYANPNIENYSYFISDPSSSTSLKGFIFNNIAEDLQNNIYISSENGGVNILNKETGQISHLKDPSQHFSLHTIKDIWFDQEYNRLIIGSFLEGLIVYDLSTKTFKSIESPLMTGEEHSIVLKLCPYANNLIVQTQKGIFNLDRKTLKVSYISSNKDIIEKNNQIIQNIYCSGNVLWVSSAAEGLYCIHLDTDSISVPHEINAISKRAAINSIVEDDRGRLYFVVENNGIIKYNPKNREIKHYQQDTGELLTNKYFRAIFTPAGKLIASFNNGLTFLDPETDEVHHIQFGKKMPVSLLNSSCALYLSPYSNELYVGGVKGLAILKNHLLPLGLRSYSIWFSSLSINNKPATPSTFPDIIKKSITCTDTLYLPYKLNNLNFEFSSSNYCQENSYYEYKLEGHDDQWTPTKHKSVTYTALSPGIYNLIVRESGNYGKNIQMHIVIRPPFYASLWAYLLYVTIFIAFIIWLIHFNKSRAILQSNLEMEHRDKLRIEEMNQMKLRFFTNISHELRTPLTLISSQLDIVLQNYTISASLKKALQRAYNQAIYMQDLITEIINFRRLEQENMPLQVTYTNMTEFVNEIYLLFKEYAKEREIDYQLIISEENIGIWIDTVQMKKVFYNLLSNAFKFTPSGKSIIIRLTKDREGVTITVTDTGTGIPQEQQAQIFERFYQADNQTSTKGSGIGLALTRTIILQHKGSISFTSKKDEGTCFTIKLKSGESHFSKEEKKIPSSVLNIPEEKENVAITPDSSKSYSVLLVEDNEELLDLLEEAFSPIYTVYKAKDGKEGLEAASTYLPDLIISDVMMPIVSGNELCMQLKNKMETSHIPVLLLTAQTTSEQIIKGISNGADDFITKPFNMQVLLLKCNNIIRNRQKVLEHFQSASPTTFKTKELATNKLDQELLDRSIALIEENLQNEEFDIEMWCTEMATSRSKLSNKIKAISGLTLNDFIMQIRLNRSCYLLINAPELNITEITWKCGFSSTSYFGKCFKARYNITPGEFRNNQGEVLN